MISKTERLLKYMELHDVFYRIDNVDRPLLLFFSSENRLLWFRYREYDLPHLKLVFEFLFIRHRYAVSSLMDTAYWSSEYIPCSPECKIEGHILLDHPLSYALTAIVDVLVVYLLQFWKTVSKVPDTKDTIKFKLDTQEITYTVDMFHDTLHLPVETLDNPFIALVNIKVIESFMQKVGYQGVVDKVSAFYTKFLAQPWQTMFNMFNRCLTTRTSGHDQTKINIL
ncbi:hypothetical protein Tco_1333718 [Tanacetum coccineum]